MVRPTVSNCDQESLPKKDTNPARVPNYLPWMMRFWSLFIFSVISLAMVFVTEYLLHTSRQNTGLFDPNSNSPQLGFRDFFTQSFGLIVLFAIRLFFYDLDQEVKKMEPFYQLSKPEGASGWDSLCVDYFRPSLYITPIIAIRHKHWAVLCSSLAGIISTSILTVLALGIFSTDAVNNGAVMNLVYTRAFEGFLCSLCFLAAVLAAIIRRRNSGLERYPGGLEALVDFTRNRKLEGSLYACFQELGLVDDMPEKKLNSLVGPVRFQLKRRDHAGQSHQYDIIIYKGVISPPWYKRAWEAFKIWVEDIRVRYLYKDNHPIVFQTVPLLFTITFLLVLFVIANGQPFWAMGKSGFWVFLEEERFARSAVSAFVNIIIWEQIDRNAKIMEPIYLLLNERGAPKSVLRLEYLGTWPLQDLYYFFMNSKKMTKNRPRDYVILMVILGTYASNVFSVSWNILNMRKDFGPGFWASFGVMIGCELIMLAALVAIFIYRRQPVLPRQLVTLASNLLFVYATDLVPAETEFAVPGSVLSSGSTQSNISTPSASVYGSPTPQEMSIFEDAIHYSASSIIESLASMSPSRFVYRHPNSPVDYADSVASSEYPETEEGSPYDVEFYDCKETNSPRTHDLTLSLGTLSQSFSGSSRSSRAPSVSASSVGGSSVMGLGIEGLDKGLQYALDGREDTTEVSEPTCSFGWFQGRDGKQHLGIANHNSVDKEYAFSAGKVKHTEPV